MAKADGWSVQEKAGRLELFAGSADRPGYIMRAWTAGGIRDGRALLDEIKRDGQASPDWNR